MLIDHVGLFLLENNVVCRVVGRLAFPIFAFFIAEGMKHTRNRKKYVFLLTIFACVSQMPYLLMVGYFKLNTLFSFLIAISFILMIESLLNKSQEKIMLKTIMIVLGLCLLFTFCLIGEIFGFIDYSIFGIAMVVAFYFFGKKWGLVLSAVIIFAMTTQDVLISGFSFDSIKQIFALISLLLILIYNGKKGNLNLKYLFYVFYPLHLVLIWCLGILI